jgi:opacity protein-like surface antigen
MNDYSHDLLTNNYTIIGIPCTIQYNFTTTKLQPYFYAGVSVAYYKETSSFYSYGEPQDPQHFVVSMALGLGIQMRISSHFYIRAEEAANINGQYQMIFQNPAVGVAYQFQ